MIRAEFIESKGLKVGFKISGHAGYADSGSDIVCAAVSSAVQLTANTLELFGCKTKVTVGNNIVKCISATADEITERLVSSLMLHLEAVSEDYPNTIKITISEV